MTNPEPDFDTEKRRRRYAMSLGASGATSLLAMLIFREGVPPDNTAIILVGFWTLFFLFKSVAGYAIWFRPYSSFRRSIILSCVAFFMTYAGLFSAVIFYDFFSYGGTGIVDTGQAFVEFHRSILGVPYIAGAVIGCIFAQSPPDVRDNF